MAKMARSRDLAGWRCRLFWLGVGLVAFFAILTAIPVKAEESRIKDLTNIRGVRPNQLIGYGLVVGLSGSGDSRKSLTTNKAVASMLTRLGTRTTPEEAVAGSIASVIVTAELPPFSRNGDRIDVRLSTVGDAKSLAGGTLILTPLRAGDSNVYAAAQGAVVVGQASGTGVQVLTVANVPGGAFVEREFIPDFAVADTFVLSLKVPDFTTNSRVADEINKYFRGFFARSLDLASVEVTIPENYLDRTVEFVSEMEHLKVSVDRKAVVIVNERTGTVVMGHDVVIAPVSIAHGNLAIQVGASKGNSKGEGQSPKVVVNLGGTTVGKLIETLNALGVRPPDLVGILQAMHAAGAMQAEMKFI